MLTIGQAFRLTRDIAGIEPFEGRMRAVVIPHGNTVCVRKYPSAADDRMADVIWDGNLVTLFGEDLYHRGKEIKALALKASSGK